MTCDCLQTIVDKWPEPFGKPIMFNRENGQLSVSQWSVKVYTLNKSGTIKQGSKSHLLLNYCPICGEKLDTDQQDR